MTDNDLMYASLEDQILWLDIVNGMGLPKLEGFSGTSFDKYGKRIPWGSGPHSMKCVRRAFELFDPTSIFEIGFNMGYSSAVWLHYMPKGMVVALDISDKDETIYAAKVLGEKYPGRFEFVLSDSIEAGPKLTGKFFDMAFIDGDHTEPYVTSDIQVCLELGIKNFVFDDWLPEFGPGVQCSVAKFPIQILDVVGNIAMGKVV